MLETHLRVEKNLRKVIYVLRPPVLEKLLKGEVGDDEWWSLFPPTVEVG